MARRWHEDHGVRVLTDRSVAALVPDAAGRAVRGVLLADGEHLPADVVVVGVGARPETGWLADAPVHLVGGAVGVDADGRTDLPGVWAVGDVAAPWDDRAQVHRRREHWASAISQGRRAASAIAGVPVGPPEPSSFWSDQYDHTLQQVGDHDPADRPVVRGDLAAGRRPRCSGSATTSSLRCSRSTTAASSCAGAGCCTAASTRPCSPTGPSTCARSSSP